MEKFPQSCALLSETVSGLEIQDAELELHRVYEIPMAMLYGGGYNKEPGATARLHANTVRLAHDFA
jgi:hypothetical protein